MRNMTNHINKYEGVIYNARDMALKASFENIPINLITAVPSVETYDIY